MTNFSVTSVRLSLTVALTSQPGISARANAIHPCRGGDAACSWPPVRAPYGSASLNPWRTPMHPRATRTTTWAIALSLAGLLLLGGTASAGDPAFSVLVFSKTTGFRHDSIPVGAEA